MYWTQVLFRFLRFTLPQRDVLRTLHSPVTQLQKQTKENVVKKRQKVSSINRAAKKLIYKEVVFDEPIVLTDKDLEDFEM